MSVVNAPVYPYYGPLQADEVAQVEFQKKYGFVKKPVTPRKISSVSAAVNHTHILYIHSYFSCSGGEAVL